MQPLSLERMDLTDTVRDRDAHNDDYDGDNNNDNDEHKGDHDGESLNDDMEGKNYVLGPSLGKTKGKIFASHRRLVRMFSSDHINVMSEAEQKQKKRCFISPDSWFDFVWDLVTLVCIVYTLVCTPLSIGECVCVCECVSE